MARTRQTMESARQEGYLVGLQTAMKMCALTKTKTEAMAQMSEELAYHYKVSAEIEEKERNKKEGKKEEQL